MSKGKNKKDRLLDEIRDELDLDKLWEQLKSKGISGVKLDQIVNKIKEEVNSFTEDKISDDPADHRGSRGQLRKAVYIREKSINETRMERLLTLEDNVYYNQFSLLSGLTKRKGLSNSEARKLNSEVRRLSVDLVVINPGTKMKNKKTIIELIELKAGNNDKDSPLSALAQIITYYYLFRKAQGVDKCYHYLSGKPKLTILAPEDYYDYWQQGFNDFRKVLNVIARQAEERINPDVKISFEKIGLSDKRADEIFEELFGIYRERKPL